MLFNSVSFAIFFPITIFLYFALPGRLRRPFLLFASCIFYMAFIPKYILILIVLILFDYFAAFFIEKAKGKKRLLILFTSIFLNIGFLVFFKYLDFFNLNITAIAKFLSWNYSFKPLSIIFPLGISFHTFQSIAYTIEVYKKKQKAERNLITYALYVMFFPQLVSGPIERPGHLIPQLKKIHNFNYQKTVEGLRLMAWGYFQKLVIADRLGILVNPVFGSPHNYYSLSLIVATFFFTFQIYADFAGYTNIARGAAKIMGIDLVINFNKPYFATSVQDFWRRWHISLSSWFRDYLYIPLGGNRKGQINTIKNILIVFLLTGLWHGANWTFVVWGAIHGVLIVATLLLKRLKIELKKPINIIVTFILVSFSWIFFRTQNLSDAKYIIFNLLNFKSETWNFFPNQTIAQFLIALLLIIFLLLVEAFKEKISQKMFGGPFAFKWVIYYILIFSILLLGIFDQVKFIYFQF